MEYYMDTAEDYIIDDQAEEIEDAMENLIEDISFNAGGDTMAKQITIDRAYVTEKLGGETKSKDLKKYIL